jgi:guanylate cyclase
MKVSLLSRAVSRAARFAAEPGDADDVRLNKALLMLETLMGFPAGVIWGLLYLAYGEWLAAAIPLSYSVLSAAAVAVFAVTRRFGLFRFIELLLILLLPFALQLVLGGFVSSSAVVLWSVMCPLGALIFEEPGRVPWWVAAYIGLVVACGLLQPYLSATNGLPEGVRLAFFVLNIGTVTSIALALLFTFVRQKNALHDQLRIEQARSDDLLLNILPKDIAALLKTGERTIADSIEGASILFADMVGFTPLTAAMSPGEMIGLLDGVFSHFDSLVDKYGAEKIRTIGDSYMVAAGVPRPRGDHAQALAGMALDMRDFILTNPACRDRRLNFRIGINSGPVVAGVIGRKKFIYDLWGDAVNTASRMESHSEPGQIQITRETYELIRESFVCEPRGAMQVKGKGEMETWFLVGRICLPKAPDTLVAGQRFH